MLRSVVDRPESEGVEEVVGEVEVGNVAGERCVRAAGFVLQSEDAAGEGFLRFARRRGL
jgi:hypothetical protein